MGKLKGQVAIVTGGGRGIGREICSAFASQGASVAVVSRTREQIAETVRRIADEGGTAFGIAVDVTDFAAIESMVRRVVDKLGPIDLLMNNAGSNSAMAPVTEADPAAWWRDVTVNLLGPFHASRAVLPGMLARRGGRIINMAGGGMATPVACLSGYGSSKAGLMRFTETLDREVWELGVKVFAMSPGLVRTEMNLALVRSGALERWGKPTYDRLERGEHVPPTMAAALAVEIASGRLDELHGRWFGVGEDLDEVLSQKDRILAEDLRTLRMTGLT